MLNQKSLKETVTYLKKLLHDLGLLTDLVKDKINNSVDIIIENGFNSERIKNNPRKLNTDNLSDILRNI